MCVITAINTEMSLVMYGLMFICRSAVSFETANEKTVVKEQGMQNSQRLVAFAVNTAVTA